MESTCRMFWGFHRSCVLTDITPELSSDIDQYEEAIKIAIGNLAKSSDFVYHYSHLQMSYSFNGITDGVIDALTEKFSNKIAACVVLVRTPITAVRVGHAVDQAFDITLRLTYRDGIIDLISDGLVTITNGAVELHESY